MRPWHSARKSNKMILLWGLLPPLVHELAHYIAALLVGGRISFRFEWGHLGPVPIPRWLWSWPDLSRGKLRIVCQAGFVAELALAPWLPWPYSVVALVHFAAYPWYAGRANDFRGMI